MAITLISTQTLVSTAATVVFSSLSSSYTDLMLVCSHRDTNTTNYRAMSLTLNSTSATGRRLGAEAGAAYSDTNTSMYSTGSGATASTFANTVIYIPNYAGSTNKSASADSVSETNASSNGMDIVAFSFATSAAITSVTLGASSNFDVGSSFSIYGITKGSSGGVTVS